MASLAGRVAVVTGSSRGIGRGIAHGLAEAGARVVVNYVSHEVEALEVVNDIRQINGDAVSVRADVSSASGAELLVRESVAHFGRIDILVNNAGLVDVRKPWSDISDPEWDRVQDVNVKSCFLCFRAAYPYLRDSRQGRVVNISSVTFWLGQANLLHYITSKGGVIGFTRALAREVGADGITVNAVTPGAILTEGERSDGTDLGALASRVAERQCIPRRGLPEDVAGAVVFLASDAASFITGQAINVDGGWAMH